jgi:hypothetical protein
VAGSLTGPDAALARARAPGLARRRASYSGYARAIVDVLLVRPACTLGKRQTASNGRPSRRCPCRRNLRHDSMISRCRRGRLPARRRRACRSRAPSPPPCYSSSGRGPERPAFRQSPGGYGEGPGGCHRSRSARATCALGRQRGEATRPRSDIGVPHIQLRCREGWFAGRGVPTHRRSPTPD